MKILVIPDIHLKPFIFERAKDLLKQGIAEQALCLMDIADDWGKANDLELYAQTYDQAIKFAKDFPNTLWCYGNHDLSYLWLKRETGFSFHAMAVVCDKLRELREALPNPCQLSYIHRIDNVLFSHAGLCEDFVNQVLEDSGVEYQNIDELIGFINSLGSSSLWQDLSPIWYRPQYKKTMFKEEEFLQVVGHTPMEEITRIKNLISCDVFSTYTSGKPIGTQKFLLLDSKTWEARGIK